jgi:hypothetical protein
MGIPYFITFLPFFAGGDIVKIKIVVYALVLSVLITASDLLFHGNGGFPVLLGTF